MSDDEFTEAGGIDGDPFAEGPAGGELAEEPGGGTWVDMLRSTEPPVTPAEVGRDLDIAEPWYNHFGAGFLKITGSEGTEAWMHLFMGGFLAVTQELQTRGDESDAEAQGGIQPEESMPEPDGQEVFEGPQ